MGIDNILGRGGRAEGMEYPKREVMTMHCYGAIPTVVLPHGTHGRSQESFGIAKMATHQRTTYEYSYT